MAKNKNPNNVTRLKEPAVSDGSWKRYKASSAGTDQSTRFKDPLKGYPHSGGRKLIGFMQWTNEQTPKKNT